MSSGGPSATRRALPVRPQPSSISGRGVRPVGIVEHRVVQRRDAALECVLLAHIPENTRVMRLKSSRKRRLVFPGPVGKCRFPFPFSPRPAISIPFSIPFRLSSIVLQAVASSVHWTLSPVPGASPDTAICCAGTFLAPIARTAARHRTAIAIRATSRAQAEHRGEESWIQHKPSITQEPQDPVWDCWLIAPPSPPRGPTVIER